MANTRIIVKNNGSIRVEGDFEIVDETGNVFDLAGRTAIGLCRCGQSANKPFCDGSHAKCGFLSQIEARALPPMAVKPKA
ncbi:MAG: CDGSH iron-sulfur domain-containing protein [Vicinamibacteria bacterium]